MKIQFRPSLLKVRRQSVKWIVVHHTIEMYPQPEAKIDNATFQLQALYNGVLEDKSGDINYHYVIEKIREDYQAIVTRPFVYLCDWPDIDVNINNRAIHVALLGSYDLKVPETRVLEVLAYKLLNPFLKMYHLAPNRIKFHRDISSNKELTCPGDFMDYGKVIALTRRFVVK
jgi:N-acetylmuramoyl-L-alanine amidase